MYFDYFYKEQSNQYTFYRIPKVLIVDDYFGEVSTDAKLLYGLLLDRVSLSSNSGWLDAQGRVYVIYTIKSIQKDMHCGVKKAVKLLKELEEIGLVEKVIRGQGKPAFIYVKNFSGVLLKEQFKDCANDNLRTCEKTILELSKQQSNNTEKNNTESSNTNLILSAYIEKEKEEERNKYYQYFYERMDIEILKERYPDDLEVLDAILRMVLDVVCSDRKTIRIAGDTKPINVVKGQFMKLHAGHVEYVLDGLKNSSSKVRNMKQYILATLYNAPLTMQSYYQAWVNHDMVSGKFNGGKDGIYGD